VIIGVIGSEVRLWVMSYRRKKEDTITKRRYEDFIRDNIGLLASIGIPTFITDDYDHFVYYLQHGCARSDAPMRFKISRSDVQRMEALRLLLERYYQAGLPDVADNSVHPEADAVAKKYGRRS
jgi:hypothetical protein